MMNEPVDQRGRHLGVAQDARPFTEAEVCGYNDTGTLVEFAQKMEEQRALMY